MKNLLRKLFSPILGPFESGDGDFHYKPLNRKVLIAVGCMFDGLGAIVAYTGYGSDTGLGYLLPTCVFLIVGTVCLIVGLLGTDRAIAKIWGGK